MIDAFRLANPNELPGKTVSAQEVLDAAAKHVGEDLADESSDDGWVEVMALQGNDKMTSESFTIEGGEFISAEEYERLCARLVADGTFVLRADPGHAFLVCMENARSG